MTAAKIFPRDILILVLCLAIPFTGCGGGDTPDANARTSAQANARWSRFPVELHVPDEIANNKRMRRDILAAGSFWERAARKRLFDFQFNWVGPIPPFSGTYENPVDIMTNLVFFVDPWPFNPSIKGTTMSLIRDSQLENVLIYIKPEDYCVGTCTLDDRRISFRRLLAHEFGHVLGLKHASSTRDIMYPIMPVGESLGIATLDTTALEGAVGPPAVLWIY